MPKITASSAVLLTRDVAASASYYRDAIGFRIAAMYGEPADFCILERDAHYLMLARVEDASQIRPHWQIREKTCSAYFWVSDADTLYAEIKAAGAKMDYGPCNQPYGVREFGIQDLDGHDIAFGQLIRPESTI